MSVRLLKEAGLGHPTERDTCMSPHQYTLHACRSWSIKNEPNWSGLCTRTEIRKKRHKASRPSRDLDVPKQTRSPAYLSHLRAEITSDGGDLRPRHAVVPKDIKTPPSGGVIIFP